MPIALCLDGWISRHEKLLGRQSRRRRRGFAYVPELYGFLFYKAQGKHPIHIDGKSIADLGAPKYLGYDLDGTKQPVFSFSAGKHTLEFTPRSGPREPNY